MVLLLLAPLAVGAETIHVALAVSPQAQGAVPDPASLDAGLGRAFADSYGRFADIAFDANPEASSADTRAAVTFDIQAGCIHVSTSLTRAGATRAIDSTVPSGSPTSLVATVNADIAFLLFASRGFSTLSLAPAPVLQAALRSDDLQELTGWNLDDLEPLGIASMDDQLTLCFPHAYLTLGAGFTVTSATLRDIYAQSGGREKLQVSGVAAADGETLLLLSENARSIVQMRPRSGARSVFAAPGLGALAARALDENHLAALSNTPTGSAIAVYSLTANELQTLPLAASYASALAVDREGNFWIWDATERRIRILTRDGIEVSAIRPLFSASIMQLPEQLEVFDDGSFLLGGSGEVWKFERTGIPDWRLTRIPGHPSEQLPASFDLAINRADGSFTLLDEPSRRLLAFSTAPGLTSASPPSPLVQWEAGTDADRALQRIAMLKNKSTLYAGYADSLSRDLLFDRADGAYLRAGESIRELAAEAPGDTDGAQLIANVVARRQEVRAVLSRPSDILAEGATLVWQNGTACTGRLLLRLSVRNAGSGALTRIRVHASLPTLASAPSLIAMDTFAPGEKKRIEIPLGADMPFDLPPSTTAMLLFTYDNGSESVSSAATVSVAVDASQSVTPAESLACGFAPNDPLVTGLPMQLVASDGAAGPLAIFAATLDSLALARASATLSAPVPLTGSTRSVLRSLVPDQKGWVQIEAGVAAALGMTVGFAASGQRLFALVDTGMGLADALSAVPELSRYQATLTLLSRGGRLCVPISGDAPAAAPGGAWALISALKVLLQSGLKAYDVAWVDESAGLPRHPPQPVPFPFFPASPVMHASLDGLRAAIKTMLEQNK